MSITHLGKTDLKISRVGLGSMPLAINGRPTREDAIKVIHRTLDLGITLIDTADAYCADENDKNYCEKLICQALRTYQGSANVNDIVVATKGISCSFEFVQNSLKIYFRWSCPSRWSMGDRSESISPSPSHTSKLRKSGRTKTDSSMAIT